MEKCTKRQAIDALERLLPGYIEARYGKKWGTGWRLKSRWEERFFIYGWLKSRRDIRFYNRGYGSICLARLKKVSERPTWQTEEPRRW